MTLGKRGEALIKQYETLKLTAYLPTPNDVSTIGWGHTRGVKMGDTCTRDQADRWFREDVRSSELAVETSTGDTLTQSMYDALVSLVFNVGPAAVSSSSTIGKALRDSNYFAAWAGFALWRKQGKKDLLGLARRRAKEMVLFLEDGLP